MKNIIKRFSCVFLSVLVLCSFCCVPLSVSADFNYDFESSFLYTPYGTVDNNLVDTYFQNCYYKHVTDYYIRIAYITNDNKYRCCFFYLNAPAKFETVEGGYKIYTRSMYYSVSSYNLSTVQGFFNDMSKFISGGGNGYNNSQWLYIPNTYDDFFFGSLDTSAGFNMSIDSNFDCGITKPINPNEPIILTGMYLDKDTESWQAFLQWLLDTGAVNDLAKFGISNGVANLSTVADVWWSNKFSPTLVYELLKNNGLRTLQYAKDLISWFNNKWYEFQNTKYVSVAFGTPGKVDPHHRAGLIDDEVDENGNITDDTITSLLREILRQITLLPSYFYKMFAGVIDNIANNVYSLNLYMSDFLSYLQQMPEIILKLVDINDTLQNLDFGGGSSILPGSSSYSEDNLFTFLDIKTQEIIEELDYQLTPQPIPEEYSLASVVGDKFAFVKQIRDYNAITYDYDFFNDSLIDTNDGLQNVLSADVDVLYLPVVASAPVPTSSRAVMYSGVVSPDVPSIEDKTRPDFNFNFGGLFGSDASVSVLDFSIFDEYKHLINVFLVALCWSAYLRRLYKKLPELLRSGVYDVSDSKE